MRTYFANKSEKIELFTPKQKELFAAAKTGNYKIFVLGGGTGSAKTIGILMYLHLVAKYCPGIRIFVFRKSEKNLRQNTIPSYKKAASYLGDHVEILGMSSNYSNGSEIVFQWADITKDTDVDNAKGGEYAIAYFNEANQIDKKYIDIALTRVGRWNKFTLGNDKYFFKPMLFLDCNPTNNWVKSEYYDKYISGTLDKDVYFQESVPSDNPFLPPEFFELLKKLPPEEYKRYVENDWNYGDDPQQLIKWEWLKDCLYYPEDLTPEALGIDVAREGDDRTVFAYRNKQDIQGLEIFKGNDTIQTAMIAIERMKEHKIGYDNVSVDVVGVGGGVVDFMRHQGYRVNDYNSGNSTEGDGYNLYKNQRAKSYWQLREALQNGTVRIVQNDDLVKELLCIKYFVKDKFIQIESKADIKKRLGYSPDLADAVVISFDTKAQAEVVKYERQKQNLPPAYSPEMSFEELDKMIQGQIKYTKLIKST